MLRIAHLIDDTNPGGVTRYLDFIAQDPALQAMGDHQIVPVPRTRPTAVRVEADLIVSHLTVNWRALPGLMMLRSRHAHIPMVHIEHSYSAGFMAHNVTKRRRFRTLLRTAYALFDRVVAVSATQADWIRRHGLVSDPALCVIPPCVDLSSFRTVEDPQGPVRVIGAIGRFDRQKGFDLLIEAFRGLDDPHLRLRMIGDGPEALALKALAEGDARIEFPGFTADPAAAIAGCDVMAMPSRWEPYGLAAQEARAAGRPVLASAIDGLSDPGRGLHLIHDNSVPAWSAALSQLVQGRVDTMFAAQIETSPERQTRIGWSRLLHSLELSQASDPATASDAPTPAGA